MTNFREDVNNNEEFFVKNRKDMEREVWVRMEGLKDSDSLNTCRDFILHNLYIGLQKEKAEDIVKRDCGLAGIESYLYIRDETYDIKFPEEFLQHARVTMEEAWTHAKDNTFSETYLAGLANILGRSNTPIDDNPIYVITNKTFYKGASAILDKKVLNEWGKGFQTERIIVIPSSVHEMILIPDDGKADIKMYSTMVKEINESIVKPLERLTDRAYFLDI